MKQDNYSDYTIDFTRKELTFLAKNADLNNPQTVKTFIAQYEVSDNYKRNLCIAYNKFTKLYGLTWTMPLYRQPQKMPKIPTTEKLKMLISKARPNLTVRLKISMETGLRPVEVMRLKVKDTNCDKKTLHPSTAKNGSARVARITTETAEMLRANIAKYDLNLVDRLFKGSSANYGKQFRQMRNNLAKKLGDPTIKTIRLYDFRHYYATTLYAKTRDILLVKQQMGHKKLETTLVYTQLLHLEEEEYTTRVAKTIEEDQELIEAGFQYVTEREGMKIYKKRK